MIDCQFGGSILFFGSDPAAPGGCFWKEYHIVACSYPSQKGEVVKE
jgi:hypothetical protein